MTKIDLDDYLLGLDGIKRQDLHLGMRLAEIIATSAKTDDVCKFADWARSLYNKQSIYVDEADYEKLLKFIKEHKDLTIIYRDNLERILKKAKTDSETEKAKKSQTEDANKTVSVTV